MLHIYIFVQLVSLLLLHTELITVPEQYLMAYDVRMMTYYVCTTVI